MTPALSIPDECDGPRNPNTMALQALTTSTCSILNPTLQCQIVDGALRFARDHKDATGFAPPGFAVYFVRREGARARMAHGAYRCAGFACRRAVPCGTHRSPRKRIHPVRRHN